MRDPISVDLDRIVAPRPGHAAADEDVTALAAHIKDHGLYSPLIVVTLPDHRYRLAAGFRRLAALRLLGWTQAPCYVYQDEPDQIVMNPTRTRAQIELSRADLSTLYAALRLSYYNAQDNARKYPEFAASYTAAATDYSMLHDEIARQTGQPDDGDGPLVWLTVSPPENPQQPRQPSRGKR